MTMYQFEHNIWCWLQYKYILN